MTDRLAPNVLLPSTSLQRKNVFNNAIPETMEIQLLGLVNLVRRPAVLVMEMELINV